MNKELYSDATKQNFISLSKASEFIFSLEQRKNGTKKETRPEDLGFYVSNLGANAPNIIGL